MLIAQQINDFITAHGKPICDGCICTGLKLTALAHSAQITAALDTTSDFNRTRAECSVCHNQRAVIHAQRVHQHLDRLPVCEQRQRPVARESQNCEVHHIQAGKSGANIQSAGLLSAVFSSSNWLHHRPPLLAVEWHPMNRNYKDFEIEPFELGRGLWHARFGRADRQPVAIDGVLFSTLNAGLAWPSPDAAVDDAKAAIDRLTKSIVASGPNPAQA